MILLIKASEIAEFIGSVFAGEDFIVKGPCPIFSPIPGSVSYLKKTDLMPLLLDNVNKYSYSDVLILLPLGAIQSGLPHDSSFCYLESRNPRLDFAKIVSNFFDNKKPCLISPHAIISPSAKIGNNVSIGHFSIIGDNVVIGSGTTIKNNVVLHDNVIVGSNCVVKSFSSIGEEGFGFAFEADDVPVRIPHLGRVVIRDNVEIGNFCTVCRGTIGETLIDSYVKIDDHCHIAHNVNIGEKTIIAASAVLSGSSTLGEGCWMGPNSSVLNGKNVGDSSLMGIGCVVIRNVAPNTHLIGNPAKKIPFRNMR